MAWRSQARAAEFLGISERTLSRRISTGLVETRREGRCVLVNVDDADQPMTDVAEIGRQLAEVATSSAIEKAHYGDLVSDIRRTMEIQIRHSESEARKAWRLGYVAGIVAVGLMIVSGWLGWWTYTDTIEHNARVVDLTEAASLARGRTEAMTDSLKLAREDLKHSSAVNIEIRERLSELRNDNEHVQTELAAAQSQRDEAVSRLKLFRIERTSEMVRMNEEMATVRVRADVLANSFEQSCEDLDRARALADDVQAELSEAHSANEQIQRNLTSALAERDVIVANSGRIEGEHTAEVIKLSKAASSARSRADVLADALDKIWGDLEKSNEANKEAEARLDDMRNENARLQMDLATAYAERDDAVDQSAQLEERFDRIQEQLAAKTTLIDQLKAVFATPETDERTAGR